MKGEEVAQRVEAIFDEYRNMYSPLSKVGENMVNEKESPSFDGGLSYMKSISAKLKRKMMRSEGSEFVRSEFDRYLSEQEAGDENLDILSWWKLHGPRFPIISYMARDVLAIPISTVASEYAFSAGGRTLDPFSSSLTPKMVQALVCAQGWLRATSPKANSAEENLENLELLEKEMEKSTSKDYNEDLIFVD